MNEDPAQRARRVSTSTTAVVFRGPPAQCREYGLVLDATGIDYHIEPGTESWELVVAGDQLRRAYEELGRYSLERPPARVPSVYQQAQPGAVYGAATYVVLLLFVAYAAGIPLFRLDWFAVGALDAAPTARFELWRWFTALTLHADAQHLLSNLLSGVLAGIAAGRLIGPGCAWGLALLAAGCAHGIEMAISPPFHRAIGASTAVFALLGLISGLAFSETIQTRERRLRRWAPVFAGCVLLALTGGGGADAEHLAAAAHVDVLGHLLGFGCGVVAGALFGLSPLRKTAVPRIQAGLGVAAVTLVALAWLAALLRG